MMCLLHRWGPWEDGPLASIERVGSIKGVRYFMASYHVPAQSRRCSRCNRVERERT